MRRIYLLILLFAIGRGAEAQCTNGSAFGTVTAPTTATPVTISTCSFQSEYSTINSVVAGNRYVVTASIAGTFITMRFSTPSGTVVACGVSPLQFTAPCAGTYYAHWNTNSACGTASSCMTTTIACSSCGAAASQCTMTSAFGTVTAPTVINTPATISGCSFQSEYSTINGCVANRVYRVTGSIAGTFITIHQGSSGGPVIASGVTPLAFTTTVAGTYYSHWNTNSACGTASSCMTTAITYIADACAPPPPSGCTFISSFGSGAISPVGAITTISTCSFAGEYSTVTGAVSGQTLRFTSSVATDWITVHSGTFNGPIIAFGQTPLTFANTFTGTVYPHWSTDNACGTQNACRTTTVQCTSCVGPANDNCTGALPITCGGSVTGTTVGATADAVPTCVTTLNSAPGVWYSFAGNGAIVTINTCTGTGYDSKLGVFSGTCAGLVCVTGNDDFCGLQSQVSFTSVIGTTYYVLVTGFSTASGAFTLTTSCVFPCTIALSSGPGTDAQLVCKNNAIANITYNTTVASNATFTGLPPGVTGSWAANVVTISGTPSIAGVYNYTVTLVGCPSATTATGTITVSEP
ncbi:MAG: hypothetical protein WAU23_11965, partial [Ferruginibacter sp.]